MWQRSLIITKSLINLNEIKREITDIDISAQATSKGDYRHYMEKEIYEQPEAVSKTIDGKIERGRSR